MLIDNSTLGAFSRCHTYGALRYWLHRQFVNEGVGAVIGKAAHGVAQAYLAGEAMVDAIERGVSSIKSHAAILGNEWAAKDLDINIGKLHSITRALVLEYPVLRTDSGPVIYHPRTKVPRWYVRRTEIPFKVQLGNSSHVYTGSLDAIVQDDIGAWNVWELKTSRYATGRTWQDQWKLSTQPKGYVWASMQHTAELVRGAIIVPIATGASEAKALVPISITYTEQQINQWLSDTISYCDWLEAIASEAGIAFDAEGHAIAPDREQVTARAIRVLSQSIPTGSYSGMCSNNTFGRCGAYDICLSTYAKGYIEAQTFYKVWSPLDEYKGANK